MKRIIFVGALLLVGCESEADKAQKIAQQLEQEARAALDSQTRDPLAMQIRKLFAKDAKTICGEVNIKRKSEYEGFQVFMVERNSRHAIVAEPTAVQSMDGEKPIEVCATPEQRAVFEKQKAAANNAFKLELDAFNRENTLQMKEAQLRLKQALAE